MSEAMNESKDMNIYKFKAFHFEKMHFRVGNKVPKARSGHRIVSTESDIYSFGGYNPTIADSDPDLMTDNDWNHTKPLFRELWRFSRSTKLWTKLETNGNSPKELASHCATLFKNNLLVFGGTGVPFGETSSNKLYVCHLNGFTWNLITCNNHINHNNNNNNNNNNENGYNEQPIEQYGQALTVDFENNCLYVCGGTTGFQYTIDVHKFDLKTHVWHHLYKKNHEFYAEFPHERYRHEIAFYNNRIFVIGGGTSVTCHSLSQVPVFDIDSHEWIAAQTRGDPNYPNNGLGFPQPRRCHDCVQMENEIYLIGGTDGVQIYDDLWKLELNHMQWTKIDVVMPRPVYFHSASVSPLGQMTIFGGVTNTNHKERTNELYTIWLKIAPLKEMAWNAVLHYIQNSKTKKSLKETLVELEIPMNYISQLL